MSPRIQVLPLQKICRDYVVTLLTHAVSDDEEADYEGLLSYLDNSTFEVLQELLNAILSSAYLDASIRFNCLQLLLREDVQRLETDVFPHSYYENILKTVVEKGRGLEHLNLKGIWVRDNLPLLCTIIRKLKKLKILVVPHIANDNVLKAVANCENLTYLDISGECSFSAACLGRFKSKTLKVLSIGYFGKKSICQGEGESSETVAKLLQNLPNLVSLSTYSFTGNALLQLFEDDPKFKTKLEYIHDTATTREACEAIVKTCPNLKSIYLNAPVKGTLDMITNLKSLHTLKLSKPYYDEVMNLLTKIGYQLQVLKLINVKDNVVDLGEICKYAPNLQTLECFKMSLTCTRVNYYFMVLESVDLSYCNTSNFIVSFLLGNSPNLRRLIIGDRIRLNDGDLFRICTESELLSLEELWFASAKYLTSASVELLMRHCPGLKVIGQINGWDLGPNDINFLKAVIASTNTELTLLTRDGFY